MYKTIEKNFLNIEHIETTSIKSMIIDIKTNNGNKVCLDCTF